MTEAVANFDTILKVFEIVSIVGGGIIIVFRTGRLTERVERIGTQQADELKDVKTKIEKIGELVTDLAVQKSRLDSLDKRYDTLDQRWEELRHGKGFVDHPGPTNR